MGVKDISLMQAEKLRLTAAARSFGAWVRGICASLSRNPRDVLGIG